jgi:hypothetical protein
MYSAVRYGDEKVATSHLADMTRTKWFAVATKYLTAPVRHKAYAGTWSACISIHLACQRYLWQCSRGGNIHLTGLYRDPFQTLPRSEEPFRNIENIDSKFILWKSSCSRSRGVKPRVGNKGSDSNPSHPNDQQDKSTGLDYLQVLLQLFMKSDFIMNLKF